MSLGMSFALTPELAAELLACPDDAAREDWLEELEESDAPYCDFDKAWDALHRCLGNGELVITSDGTPLAHAVFGSRTLMDDEETDTFAGQLPADEVPAVAEALDAVDQAWLKARYQALGPTGYDGPLGDEDFEYTWDALVDLRAFLRQAAIEGAAIVFTVSG